MGDFNAKLEVITENITQSQSRNGKHLEKMLQDTDTTPVTLKADKGAWTRSRKRLNTTERSIIDYVIMTKNMSNNLSMVHVDEDGLFKLKGKEETDHNTIIVEVELPTAPKITKQKMTNFKDEAGWKKFNQIIIDQARNDPPTNYDQYEKAIKKAIKESFKTITINKGQYKYKKTERAKSLKKDKKIAKQIFEKAPPHEKQAKLQMYFKAQQELRAEL